MGITPNYQVASKPAAPPADRLSRFGGWLFKHRTALPLPIVAALLVLPPETHSRWVVVIGVALVAIAELVRLWAVRHIGVVSRTRSDRLGPLVTGGPFAYVRNPLYLANVILWAGFALSAWLPVAALLIVLLLALEYHAIVGWEEQLLVSRLGDEYRAYMLRVPRWVPSFLPVTWTDVRPVAYSWRDTLFSERGTLIAIAVGYSALWLKSELWK